MKIVWNESCEPPVWTIDGCRFAADIPTYRQAAGLYELLGNEVLPFKKVTNTPIILRDEKAAIFVLRCDARDKEHLLLLHPKIVYQDMEVDDPWRAATQFVSMNKDGTCIQVIDPSRAQHQVLSVSLTPLDEKGRDISWDFRRDNPDGSLVSGGTLYIDGQPVKCDGWKWDYSKPPEAEDGSQVWIGDTVDDEYAIRWHTFNGRLVALYPMFRIESAEISNVFHGWRLCGND